MSHWPTPPHCLVCSRRAHDRAPPPTLGLLTMALVLGTALGPHTIHVEVRDAETGILRSKGAARHSPDGQPSDDPALWWRSFVTAVRQAGEREIAAISVSGGHPGLVLLDGADAVLSSARPWSKSGADTTVARLTSLKRSEPAILDRLGMLLLPHDWLTHRLTGRAVTDRGSASLTDVWSLTTEDWRQTMLRDLAPHGARDWWRDRLPDVLGPSQRADWLDAPIYDLLGLRGRPIVGPGTGQDMAIALALGLRPGRAGVSLHDRTAALVGVPKPIDDRGGPMRCRADAGGRFLVVAPAGDGTDLLAAVRSLLDISTRELNALATEAAGAAPGLAVLPQAAGGDGTTLTGLAAGTARRDLVGATIDGIACTALDQLDLVLRAGGRWHDGEPLRLGAPRDHVEIVAQVLADLSGRPVRPTAESSLAAAGACIQAAAVLTGASPDDVADEWDLGAEGWVEPNETAAGAERRQAHADARARLRTRAD